jgi:hypothetical protein
MAKSKSSTNERRKPAQSRSRSRKGPSEPAAPALEKLNVPAAPERTGTKQALVLALLQRQEGASLAELVEATGWLAHTTRAALTRLRQSGHELQKDKRDTGETAYRVAAPRLTRSRKAA